MNVATDGSRRVRWGAIVGSAVIVAIGSLLGTGLADEAGVANAVVMAAFYSPVVGLFVAVVAGVVFAVAAAVANVRRGGRSGGWIVWPAVATAAAFTGYGAYEHLPRTRFRELVADPVPASVHDLTAEHPSSFGEGNAWVFAFGMDPTDFDAVRRSLDLREVAAPTTEPNEYGTGPAGADRLLLRDAAGLYRRPAGGRYYVGRDRTVVVTDGKAVYVYRNFWSNPNER